jgi:hypothetical protein
MTPSQLTTKIETLQTIARELHDAINAPGSRDGVCKEMQHYWVLALRGITAEIDAIMIDIAFM